MASFPAKQRVSEGLEYLPSPTFQTLQGHEHNFRPTSGNSTPSAFDGCDLITCPLQNSHIGAWEIWEPPPSYLKYCLKLCTWKIPFPRDKQGRCFSFQPSMSLSLPRFPRRPLDCCSPSPWVLFNAISSGIRKQTNHQETTLTAFLSDFMLCNYTALEALGTQTHTFGLCYN